jgi:hypothetical protein
MSSSSAQARRLESVKKILRYFVRHPEAADTHEGITRWRLLEETIYQTTEETRDALAWLVSQGFLRETSVAGGTPIFRLNSGKRKEAEEFLGQSSRGGG